MKTGDIARLLGVSSTTIREWIARFPDFFSEQRTKQRQYTEADMLTLATIANLSADGHSLAEIENKLATGYRVEHPGVSNLGIDTRMIPAAAVEQMIDASELRTELEITKSERDKLAELLEVERGEHQNTRKELEQKKDVLNDRINQLIERAARAEMEAKMLRERLDRD